ncbi:MAG: iron complex transport system ATP-binding protein, partial [Cyclobacteriaceae bacterium]
MSLFNTKDLTIGYRQKSGNKILQKNLALTINSGEIVSLMGQNGVGKTTFIKTISGLLEPLSGDVFYNGTSLQKISNQDLSKKLSLVLTEKPFSFNMSVLELVALGRHPYSNWIGILSNEDKEVIEWAITETNTNYLADQKLYQLSDGQLQKVMIARALAQQTDLIFLDEPAAHLDLHNKIEVMMLLRKIAKQGKSILISTHDMQISTQLSDKLWLFNFNEPTRIGAPEDLILDGSLEQTLYLKDYGYDMIHGVVNIPQT